MSIIKLLAWVLAVVVLIIIIIAYKFFKDFKDLQDELKLWLAPGAASECVRNVDASCNFNYMAESDEMLFAVVLNMAFIRGLYDSSITRPDVLIYSPIDPTLPIAGVYNNLNGKCWVAIRGTLTGADLKADIDYVQESAHNTSGVHAGMYNVYSQIKSDLLSAINKNNSLPLCICGHSLGAALAIYLAADTNSTTYAIAPPRAGNSQFASSVKGVTSIINIADLVPTLPWSYMPEKNIIHGLQYSHTGNLVTFNYLGDNILACHGLPTYYLGLKQLKQLQ